ncbi:mannose-1-phosphate guanylyltransferase [bacterium]|nr:mannose-1-phosphate guanylyltransferase [candidate division CSSED10-310 bacterium]
MMNHGMKNQGAMPDDVALNHLYAVVMAGGRGTRFWPESRSHRPKQFLTIVGDQTMIRQTVTRVTDLVPPERLFVVTAHALAGPLKETLPEIPPGNLLLEPVGRNTAPCVAWASAVIAERDPDAVLAILASDHVIEPRDAFQDQLVAAVKLAFQSRRIVTLGIPPDRPETGFGYLQMGQVIGDIDDLSYSDVLRFIEKPDRLTAERYVAEGGYLWNSGMFVFSAATMLKEMETHQPEILEGILEIVESRNDAEVIDSVFPDLPSVSIDFGVMERTRGILGMPVSFDWSDVGNWQTMYHHIPKNEDGNHIRGQALLQDCRGVLSWSGNRLIVGIGLDNIIVVETEDAVLVCRKDLAQVVGDVVKSLERSESGKRFI